MRTYRPPRFFGTGRRPPRRGAVLVLAAAALIMIFGFAAFTVDIGWITLTRAQLQGAADSAALAAGLELPEALGLAPTRTSAEAETLARGAAGQLAALHRAGEQRSAYLDQQRDCRFGHYSWDSAAGAWRETWGLRPYNLVEVSLHRDQQPTDGTSTSGDAPLPLFVAPVLGHDDASLSVTSAAALLPGVGIRVPPGSSQTAPVLPFTLDLGTWDNMVAGGGPDDYCYYPDTGTVGRGPDGIHEVNLYPEGTTDLPPGNRGTLDLGALSNSTDDLNRQILNGLNATDLEYFGGEIRTDQGDLYIQGDTGISAGFKEELNAIVGEERLLPIFSNVSGPGNNATYTVVKLVGVRIVDVRLTGSKKYVMVQPAPFSHRCVVPGEVPITGETYFSPVMLIR